jgi:hypothetical protein
MQTRVEQLIEKAKSYELRISALASKKDKAVPDLVKLEDLKRRHAQVLEWIATPEKDQLVQPPPKPSGQIVRPKGIESKEAHPAS